MTFEIHAKKLGRIEFHPSAAIAYTQDPDTFGEYVKQVRRWILGFWQTVRRHRFHTSVFWVALAVFIVELISSSLMFVLLIPVLAASMLAGTAAGDRHLTRPAGRPGWRVSCTRENVIIGVLIPDYLLTIMAAWVLRRPRYLLLGFGFPLMRIVDAALCLRVLPMAWRARSSGVWVSPTRRANGPAGGRCRGSRRRVRPALRRRRRCWRPRPRAWAEQPAGPADQIAAYGKLLDPAIVVNADLPWAKRRSSTPRSGTKGSNCWR